MRAEALADLISELSAIFATKKDLELLRKDVEALEMRLENKLNALETRLTWRFIALTAFLGTVLSLINILAS